MKQPHIKDSEPAMVSADDWGPPDCPHTIRKSLWIFVCHTALSERPHFQLEKEWVTSFQALPTSTWLVC